MTSEGMPSLWVMRMAMGVKPAENTIVRMMSSARLSGMGPPRTSPAT